MNPFSETDIESFVAQETATWRTLPDSVFNGVPADIAAAAKHGDREQLEISRIDLLAAIRQRRDKESFAYQYDLWMTDYIATTLDFLENPRGDTPEIQTAMLNVLKNGLLCKLNAMEKWYHTVFTVSPIGESPDQEMLEVARTYQPQTEPPQLHYNTPSQRNLSEPHKTVEPDSSSAWIIGGVLAFIVLLWLCGGGLSGDSSYNPYNDDPLKDPDLYRDGPWTR